MSSRRSPPTFDRDALVAFVGSMGWIVLKADDEHVRLLDEVRALLTSDLLLWETRLH